MSSPIALWLNPPTSTTASRRNNPNAPDTMVTAFCDAQARRKSRKLRMYSTIWNRASQLRGMPPSMTRLPSTREPLEMAT